MAADLPDHEWVTLTDALTWLATGTSASLADWPPTKKQSSPLEKRSALIKAVLAEKASAAVLDAAGNDTGSYADFPSQLVRKPSVLVAELDAHRGAWPPSAARLYAYAKKAADEEDKEKKALDAQWERVCSWARMGVLKVSGIPTSGGPSTRTDIAPQYFSHAQEYVIGFPLGDNIRPLRDRHDKAPKRPTYQKVHIERVGLLRMTGTTIAATSPDTSSPLTPSSDAGPRADAGAGAIGEWALNKRYGEREHWPVKNSESVKSVHRSVLGECKKVGRKAPSENTVARLLGWRE